MKAPLLAIISISFLISCSPSKNIAKSAKHDVINDNALLNAHVGISVYDPSSGKYLYNYQGDKYFVPASNTKIPTCYTAMKYLGDSLVGLKIRKTKSGFYEMKPTGDPSFLHPDFTNQPVYDFLKNNPAGMSFIRGVDHFNRWGSGWSWNDYSEDYVVERSVFPIYGNVYRFSLVGDSMHVVPRYSVSSIEIKNSIDTKQSFVSPDIFKNEDNKYVLQRNLDDNGIFAIPSYSKFTKQSLPFRTNDNTVMFFLKDTVKNPKLIGHLTPALYMDFNKDSNARFTWVDSFTNNRSFTNIYSQPTDSMLKRMMHRSDNFFAEQSLLMVSNEMLDVMDDNRIIDSVLKTDFKALPQKPSWVDGSGLSRYNLFTPQDMVFILDKMQSEFGIQRIKEIFATGGEGTLSNYYKNISGFIFAKTGTLSGVVALSGFLYTKKNKMLIFSVLVNNHNSSATQVRRAVEKFITGIRENY